MSFRILRQLSQPIHLDRSFIWTLELLAGINKEQISENNLPLFNVTFFKYFFLPRFIHNLRTFCGFLWITIPFLSMRDAKSPYFSTLFCIVLLLNLWIELSTFPQWKLFPVPIPPPALLTSYNSNGKMVLISHIILCFELFLTTIYRRKEFSTWTTCLILK